MSRTRQIPVMDITQRERMLHQTQPPSEPIVNCNQPAYHPMARPMQSTCRPRGRRPVSTKFRLSDTPTLISNGCSSVRQLCNSVQNITMDLNNLIGSVEGMVPLLNTYLAVVQSRSTASEQELEPPIDVTARECNSNEQYTKDPSGRENAYHPNNTVNNPTANAANQTSTAAQNPMSSASGNSTMTPPMPRPEDIQQLLENPLVRNLLTGFMQNGPFPNTNTVKENGPR